MMNPTNATSSSQICLAVCYGYKDDNDKSTGAPQNSSGSTSAAASLSGGGTGLVTPVVRGDTDS